MLPWKAFYGKCFVSGSYIVHQSFQQVKCFSGSHAQHNRMHFTCTIRWLVHQKHLEAKRQKLQLSLAAVALPFSRATSCSPFALPACPPGEEQWQRCRNWSRGWLLKPWPCYRTSENFPQAILAGVAVRVLCMLNGFIQFKTPWACTACNYKLFI